MMKMIGILLLAMTSLTGCGTSSSSSKDRIYVTANNQSFFMITDYTPSHAVKTSRHVWNTNAEYIEIDVLPMTTGGDPNDVAWSITVTDECGEEVQLFNGYSSIGQIICPSGALEVAVTWYGKIQVTIMKL